MGISHFSKVGRFRDLWGSRVSVLEFSTTRAEGNNGRPNPRVSRESKSIGPKLLFTTALKEAMAFNKLAARLDRSMVLKRGSLSSE